MEKVSIIIPAYNSEKYLKRCINSICNQTYKNIEIIIIDDGSTDDTFNICEEYAKRDDRIKFIHKKNEGVSVARNRGIKSANGKYIMFVDSDDWIENNAVEICIKYMEDYNAQIGQFNYYFSHNDKEIKRESFITDIILAGEKEKNEIECDILFPYFNKKVKYGKIRGCWSKIFLTKFLIDNNIKFQENLSIQEDTVLFLQAINKVNTIIFFNEYLYHYFQNGESVTKKYDDNKLTKNEATIKVINKLFEKNKNKKLKKAIQLLYWELLLSAILTQIYNEKNISKYKDKKNLLKKVLKKQAYKNAMKLNTIKFLNFKQKIIFLLLKLKCYYIVYILTKIKNK